MLKVINGGIETLVEDWPGRLGYLGKGMSASGAFDNVALGLGNILVGNAAGEAGLEITGGFFEAEFDGDRDAAIRSVLDEWLGERGGRASRFRR